MTEYRDWLRHKNLSPRSIDQWLSVARRFYSWHGGPLDDVTTRDVEEWLFVEMAHLAPASQANYLKALKSLIRWATREGHVTGDPAADVTSPRVPQYRPEPTDEALLARALESAFDPRIRAMICLGAYAGLRVSEMEQLEAVDVRPDRLLVHGKGAKEREVPLHDLVADALGPFLGVRGPALGLWRGQATSILTGHMRAMGCTRRRPAHALRARYATRVYREFNDLLLVAELLGHSSTDVTRRYIGLDRDPARLSALRSIA